MTTSDPVSPSAESPSAGSPSGAEAGLSPERAERWREGLTMALYVSLSLLAVMVALPTSGPDADRGSVAFALFATSLGLVLAHQIAFRLSSRLIDKGAFTPANRELIGAQLAGGGLVTLLAVAPVLVFGPRPGEQVAELLLLLFISLVGYGAARTVPVSRTRALLYVAFIWVLTLGVLFVKSLVHH